MMYPISFLFNIPSTAYITMIVANLFVGLTATLATFVLDLFDDPELAGINDILKSVFLIFPNYCLGRGILDVARHEYEAQYDSLSAELRGETAPAFSDPLAWNLVGRNLFLMAVQAAFWFAFTVAIEYRGALSSAAQRLRALVCGKRRATEPSEAAEVDPGVDTAGAAGAAGAALDASVWQQACDSVAAERARVLHDSNKDNLRVLDLRKSYQKRDVSA